MQEIEKPESSSKYINEADRGELFSHTFCRDLGTTSQNTLVPHTQSIEPQNPTRLGLPILPKSPILGLGLALGVGLGLGYFERSR